MFTTFDKSSTNTPKCENITHIPNVNRNTKTKIGIICIIVNDNGTWYTAISPATINSDTNSLKKFTHIFTNTNINLGRYTFVTIALFEDISFTDVVRLLLKKVHIVLPINTKANIYCSLVLNTASTKKAYTNIKHSGSKNHQSHPKYEPATSEFNSAFAAYIEYL
jgi:hypothetical protein